MVVLGDDASTNFRVALDALRSEVDEWEELSRSTELSGVTSQGYCFQVDLVWKALVAGLSVVEVPIVSPSASRAGRR